MTRPANSFRTLVEASRVELSAIAPQFEDMAQCEPVSAILALLALARCRLTADVHDKHVAARLTCRPAPQRCALAAGLLDHLAEAVSDPLLQPGKTASFGLDTWIERHGFLGLVIRLLETDTPLQAIIELATHVAQAIQQLHASLTILTHNHISAVLRRDLRFEGTCRHASLTRVQHWLLAPAVAGRSDRETVIARRMQALGIYGAIASVLMEPKITRAIDRGHALNPMLIRRLGLSEAHLRRIQHLCTIEQSMTAYQDQIRAITTLLLHEVPLKEWPQGAEWGSSLWGATSGESLFRPDYVGTDIERRDAMNALREDLLYPLAAKRAQEVGLLEDYRVRQFVQGFHLLTPLAGCTEHRLWLRALREAVVGPRGIKSFHEAIALWHRRAATVAAVRHEQKTDKPGWPAVCPPWTAPDGAYQIVPLTNADDLVAEGQALNHCVGGYYPQCRRGDTQIFSLRRGEERLATLELTLTYGPDNGLSIAPGQFKAHANSKPADDLSLIVRDFLDTLRRRRHPTAHRDILVHRRERQRDGDYAWNSAPLPLDHARKAWPLYRTLLPKGVPETYDQWCEQSGLTAAMDRMIDAVSRMLTKI